ncbi:MULTISPECIES: beta-ketoacyl synthase N-terminal-like domain-containing protein [unclassified Streptomyces]|uniref:beta-ketoacyl synthase N-terminal-like domain-containing protein n=1 Tax=unclassified Streptomyces TaxID=2593676 RepID=UPI00073B8A9E|nr:beta-ketoacyl synthase N-terminal-like domain-containing protein [Streptomyces sp. AVP053U2]ODA71255.1 3-oxoacyl-[acyl-carrier-protein] synthase 2 [Streptomyces sp. AVP053U2]
MSWIVTGMGAVASIGADVEEIFDSLIAGRSGLGPLHGYDREKFRAQVAYEIDDRPAPGVDVPLRATRWLERAVAQAAADAGLGDDLSEVPVLVGTTLRELRSVELSWRDGIPFDAADLHFGTMLRHRFGAADTHTVANACSASLYTLALGADLLDLDAADTVVVAGVDTITESTYGLLDRCYPEAPDRVRPFDRERRGMLQGEGAVAVVLRREADGPGPGSRVHARVRGVAVNCDAYHPSAPDAKSITAAVHEAHRRAGVRPADIDLVMLHGTGTPLNDEAESSALGTVFAGLALSPYMTAIKSMTGHTAGASGLHSLVAAVDVMRTGTIPPTVYLDDPVDAVAGFRLVRGGAVRPEEPLRLAQIDSFGFGGLNAVAVVERVDDEALRHPTRPEGGGQ